MKIARYLCIAAVLACTATQVAASPLSDLASGIESAGQDLGNVFTALGGLLFMVSVITLILDAFLIYTGWRIGALEIGSNIKRFLLGLGSFSIVVLFLYSIGSYVADLGFITDIAKAIVEKGLSFLRVGGG